MGATRTSKQTPRRSRRLPPHVFLLLLLLLPTTPLSAAPVLYLNTALTSPLSNAQQSGFVDRLLGEALQRLGYRLRVNHLPAERALINANAGIDDGDLLRIGGLSELYPNLVQVPEKIIDVEFVAFTRRPDIDLRGWHSLPAYSVAIINGWKILEQRIPPGTELTKVENNHQLFNLLLKNRVDLVLYSRWPGLSYLQDKRIRSIRLLRPPLERRAMFVYLHRRHHALAPRLAHVLAQLKTDGTYQRLFRSILSPLMEN